MSFKNTTLDLFKPERPLNLAKKIVIVDGMIGGGKNLLSYIVSSLPNVEMWVHRTQIEQICALYHMEHISLDAAKTLINTWLEEEILNQNMSRNINFKPSDISSVFCDPKPLRYFKRLFKSPSQAKENVENEMPTLNLMTHVNTSYAKPLFDALGERLTFIRVSRHPMTVNMLKLNEKWTDRWGIDDRHSYILYKTLDKFSKPIHLPFYVKNIEKTYLSANPIDRSILLFDQWIRNGDNFIDNIKKSTAANIIEIPYENFVFHPEEYIKKIASTLEVTPDNTTNKMMRRQRVPRSFLNDGPKKKFKFKIGFENANKNLSLSENFAEGRAYAAETASLEALPYLTNLRKIMRKDTI